MLEHWGLGKVDNERQRMIKKRNRFEGGQALIAISTVIPVCLIIFDLPSLNFCSRQWVALKLLTLSRREFKLHESTN